MTRCLLCYLLSYIDILFNIPRVSEVKAIPMHTAYEACTVDQELKLIHALINGHLQYYRRTN